MSNQKELTYILGAGASFQSIPLVKTFANRFRQFSNFLAGLNKDEIIEAGKQIEHIYKEFKSHQSFDTYFKKLYHIKDTDTINYTKKMLNLYFLWEHSIESLNMNINDGKSFQKESLIDKRYDALIAGLLHPRNDVSKLFCKTNFITWNYDLNLFVSLKNYFGNKLTYKEFLKKITNENNQFIWELPEVGIKVINMNGFFYSEIIGKETDIANFSTRLLFPNFINETFLDWFFQTDDLHKLRFAWEDDSTVINEAIETINNSKNIVVIGYTFPLYNRIVDYKYFNKEVLLQKNLYLQDIDVNNIAESLKDNFNLILNPDKVKRIENCDSFFVPSDIIDDSPFKKGNYSIG